MQYLLQVRLKNGEVENFIGDENQIGDYIRQLYSHGEMVIFQVAFKRMKKCAIRFMNINDGVGGYVEDYFGYLMFNF